MSEPIHQENNYRFPWQSGNHFELLIDGPQFFQRMLEDIRHARHYVLLEMYLVQPGHISQAFFEAFIDAVQRNVAVYLLLDAFGSATLSDRQRRQLSSHGVHLTLYNPIRFKRHRLALFRDHRKIMVVDGRVAYVGGAGLVDEFDLRKRPERNWRDNMMRIQGANVEQWQSLFVDNWQRWSTQPVDTLPAPIHDSNDCGRVAITRGPQLLEIKRSFLNHVHHAQQRVWVCTAYFVPSRKLRRALRRAAQRGVDVRILVPGAITDVPMARYLGQKYYARLLDSGVKIFEYQHRFLHSKIVLCDNWTSMGSCNIDRWNMHWNLDANQEVRSEAFTRDAIDMFEQDFADSIQIMPEMWQRRSLLNRLRIAFWTMLAYLAERLLIRLRFLKNWRQMRDSKKGK